MPANDQQKGKRRAGPEATTQPAKRQKRKAQENETPATRGPNTTHTLPATSQTQKANPPASTALLEGEISPKNFGTVPKRRGSSSSSTSTSSTTTTSLLAPPPRKRRRRASPHPPVSGLTRASVAALLPGSAFGHAAPILARRHWTVKDEHALRKAGWTPSDEAALAARLRPRDPAARKPGTPVHAEVLAWRAMAALFGCEPPDLFRYGLKLLRDDDDDSGGGEKHELFVAPRFWPGLLRLLPHPFWGGDVAALRLALQLAVMHRAGPRGHAGPLAPPWSRVEPAFVQWLRELQALRRGDGDGDGDKVGGIDGWRREMEDAERRVEVAGVAEFRSRVQVRDRTGMRELDELIEYGARELAGGVVEPVPAYERFLFMVRGEDVEMVTTALNSMYSTSGDDEEEVRVIVDAAAEAGKKQRRKPDLTVVDFFRTYWHGLPERDREVTEADTQWLLEQKRMAIIAERREALIRHRLQAAGDSLDLLDIPPFDPDPDFHLYSYVNEAQLFTIRGRRPPPATYRWAREHLGHRADAMTLHASATMARCLGPTTGAAGLLIDGRVQAPVFNPTGAYFSHVENLRSRPGLLYSSRELAGRLSPPATKKDLVAFAAWLRGRFPRPKG